MNSWLSIVLLLLLACCHVPFVVHFIRTLREGYIPGSCSFAAMGIVLYYDLGIVFQLLGVPYQNPFFPALRDCTDEEVAVLILLVIAAPYLLWLGAGLLRRRNDELHRDARVEMSVTAQRLFPLVFLPLCLALAGFGAYAIWGAQSIAEIKPMWVSFFGSSYIVFLFPMFLLAFFVRTSFAKRRSGQVILYVILACAVVATLFLGQRTMTLLPFLILAIFHYRVRILRLALAAVVLITISAATLSFYKGYAVQENLELGDGLLQVLNNDVTRANVLARALRESREIGTHVLPFAGQGYVHSATLYIPRKLLPEKGYSTTAYFTGLSTGEDVEYLGWGLGVGFLEQISLNFGFWFLVPTILLYGLGLGSLDRVSESFPAAVVGIRLGAVWMSGYDASSLVLYFGSMTIFAMLLESFVASRTSVTHGNLAMSPSTLSSPTSLLPDGSPLALER